MKDAKIREAVKAAAEALGKLQEALELEDEQHSEVARLQEELDASQAEKARLQSENARLRRLRMEAAENNRPSSSSAGDSSAGEATGKIKDHYYLGPFRINYERDENAPKREGHWSDRHSHLM